MAQLELRGGFALGKWTGKSLHSMKITRSLLGVSRPPNSDLIRVEFGPFGLGGGPNGSWHCLQSNVLFSHGQGLFLPLLDSPRMPCERAAPPGDGPPQEGTAGAQRGPHLAIPSPAGPPATAQGRRAPLTLAGLPVYTGHPEGRLLTAHAYPSSRGHPCRIGAVLPGGTRGSLHTPRKGP